MAVSDCNQKGNPVLFDGDRSYIIPKHSPGLDQMRKLVEEMPDKIPMHQQNGVYKLRTWSKPAAPFQGPGW